MKKQTIALIKKDFHFGGGLEKVTTKIVGALMDAGMEVSFYTSKEGKLPCATYTHAPKGFLKSQQLKKFDRWACEKTAKYDVIFSMDRCSRQTHHRAGNGVHAAYLDLRATLEGPLQRLSFALNPLHRLHLQLEKMTFESSETRVIIVNSAMVRHQILHYYNTPPSKIHVIHNGGLLS